MSMDLDVVMIGAATSLSEAVDTLIRGLHAKLGLQLDSPLHSLSTNDKVEFGDSGWRDAVGSWSRVLFSLHQPGPPLSVVLQRLRDNRVACRVGVGEGSLQFCCKQEKGALERILFAPLFQIALALEARAGVGTIELEEELTTDKAVVRRLGLTPGSKTGAMLGFLRRDDGNGKPAGPRYSVTGRPEGYWLLESRFFVEQFPR